MHLCTETLANYKMIVHPGSTNVVGLLTAVKAPVRRPDGTRNIKFTVAAFRPWRGSPASIASDPTLNAALRFARPRRRLPGEFSPAGAGCWYREPLPPRLARPKKPLKFQPTADSQYSEYPPLANQKSWQLPGGIVAMHHSEKLWKQRCRPTLRVGAAGVQTTTADTQCRPTTAPPVLVAMPSCTHRRLSPATPARAASLPPWALLPG